MSAVHFDATETSLMFNAEVFLLKRRINQKIYILFEDIKNRLKDTAEHKQFSFPPSTDMGSGKISQGENYQSCPWVLLDFPRLFTKTEMFAFRTLFWYGHYFSCSLLCSGNIAVERSAALLANRKILAMRDIYFCTHPDPWLHDISSDGYLPIEQLTDGEIMQHISERNYFKISSKFNLTEPEEIINKVEGLYKIMLASLS